MPDTPKVITELAQMYTTSVLCFLYVFNSGYFNNSAHIRHSVTLKVSNRLEPTLCWSEFISVSDDCPASGILQTWCVIFIRKFLFKTGTRLHSPAYSCTEGFIGVNAWVDKTPQQYTLLPNEMVVEFIPEHLRLVSRFTQSNSVHRSQKLVNVSN